MSPLARVAFVGNHLPRRCGIATFTHDLHAAIAEARPRLQTSVVAMTEPGAAYAYPKPVSFQVREQVIGDYAIAAEYLNAAKFEVVSLQHEFGIFGGEAGGYVIELLVRLDIPIVTTLHSVLVKPTAAQDVVMRRIIDLSTKIVVMSKKGRDILEAVYGVPAKHIEIIAHGIPDFPFVEPDNAKEKFHFRGKKVILTFGLLSPNKGIEVMLDAMPAIIQKCPNVVYVVLGATHPNLVRDHGEAYRDSLIARVEKLGISNHVAFFNQFVDQATLLDFIAMCDVYVTPYLTEAQMTSGTLSYSFGLGKAIVSTPYWHALELLGEGRGIIVPFSDSQTMGAQILSLLTDDRRRIAMAERAYTSSRSMTWAQTAQRYLRCFETSRVTQQNTVTDPRKDGQTSIRVGPIPDFKTDHLLSMCDSTGLLQHAVHCVPDRSHGYCTDDNARALLLACGLRGGGEHELPETLTTRFAAFIQHAWNPDIRRFRNFMSYDRRWLEDQGSQDSHGRTLWALGHCALKDSEPSRRRWATDLFKQALPAVEGFTSPRAWGFTLLGLDAYCEHAPDDPLATRLRHALAERLKSVFLATRTSNWVWFEPSLAYDNARLCEALLVTGHRTGNAELVDIGLKSLRWLCVIQTAPQGHFRPVGTQSFGLDRQRPLAFDQQPVEAAATIAASLAAWKLTGETDWLSAATGAFDWFLGHNDLRVALVDRATGSCRDGLHADRANENRGAESVLSYLLGQLDMRQFNRATRSDATAPRTNGARDVRNGAIATQAKSGTRLVTVPLLEPTNAASATQSGTGRHPAVQTGNRAQGTERDG